MISIILGLAPIVLDNSAYELLKNNISIVPAAAMVYTNLIGGWFWAIMLLFLLVVTYIKTEDFTYIFIYGTLGVLALSIYGLLPAYIKMFMYISLAIALTLTLYAFFIRKD
jgi:hypothetical protein